MHVLCVVKDLGQKCTPSCMHAFLASRVERVKRTPLLKCLDPRFWLVLVVFCAVLCILGPLIFVALAALVVLVSDHVLRSQAAQPWSL